MFLLVPLDLWSIEGFYHGTRGTRRNKKCSSALIFQTSTKPNAGQYDSHFIDNNMKRALLIFSEVAVLLGLICFFISPCTAQAKPPNIIVIVADDLGYADIGVHGGKDIPTPNIDSLAKNGVRFTDAYVSGPYCSPTRAGLMTGRYPQRFGHEFNILDNRGTHRGRPAHIRAHYRG